MLAPETITEADVSPRLQDRLRVLHVMPSLHVGGAGRLLLRNLTLLERKGVQNYVCYLIARDDIARDFTEAGFTPLTLEHQGKRSLFRTTWRLVQLIRKLHVDIVHTNLTLDGGYGRLAGALSGVPVVATLHDADKPAPLVMSGGLPKLHLKILAEDVLARLFTRRFVAVSGAVRDHYVAHHWVPPSRVDVIYSSLDCEGITSRIDPAAVRALRDQLSLRDAYPVLLNVARLHPIKDQSSLIEAMPHVVRQCPGAHLLVAGDGEMAEPLRALIRSRGMEDHVTLLGQRSDVPTLLGLADLFVLSSLSEGLPGSVLEAMAAAKPVIATRVGGIPEVVVDGVTGRLVPPEDPVRFADAVVEVASLPDRGVSMGISGREVVQTNFNPTTAIRKLQHLYADAIRKS